MSVNTQVKRKIKLKKAPLYCNVFYNNDITHFETVIFLLISIFNLSEEEAIKLSGHIHINKKAVVYVNSKEVCDFKKELVIHTCNKINENNLKHDVEIYENN